MSELSEILKEEYLKEMSKLDMGMLLEMIEAVSYTHLTLPTN